MTFSEITQLIKENLGENVFDGSPLESGLMPIALIKSAYLEEVCRFLYTAPQAYFDFLSCITGIDNGLEANTIDIVYNLYSIPYEHSYCIKVTLQRNIKGEELPKIHTVSHIWRTANWHEREIFDLLGVTFENHPDLRRILLPADWEGYPLRKDYVPQDQYHTIIVKSTETDN